MIGPSDLNRIPRWMPERQSEGLRRYETVELGGETLGIRATSQFTQGLRGFRAWLASRIRPARAPTSPAASKPLGTGIAAVHFSGETGPDTRGGPRPAAAFATPALVFAAGGKDTESDELCPCDL